MTRKEHAKNINLVYWCLYLLQWGAVDGCMGCLHRVVCIEKDSLSLMKCVDAIVSLGPAHTLNFREHVGRSKLLPLLYLEDYHLLLFSLTIRLLVEYEVAVPLSSRKFPVGRPGILVQWREVLERYGKP